MEWGTWGPRGTSTARAPQPPPSAWKRVGLTGFELMVRAGVFLPDGSSPVQSPNFYNGVNVRGDAVGDILRGTEHPYGVDPFGISVSLGYRFLPWLSAGATFTYASFFALDNTNSGDYVDSTSQLQRQMWTLGAYGRYYITQLSSRLQPWVELGVAYSDDNASYVRINTQTSSGPEQQQYYLEEKGIDVRLVAGLDVRMAPVFSLGPWIGYERVIPVQGCVEIDVDTNAPKLEQQYGNKNVCSNPPVQASGYGVLSGGLFVKLTWDPWQR
jgi:hypothetical protein